MPDQMSEKDSLFSSSILGECGRWPVSVSRFNTTNARNMFIYPRSLLPILGDRLDRDIGSQGFTRKQASRPCFPALSQHIHFHQLIFIIYLLELEFLASTTNAVYCPTFRSQKKTSNIWACHAGAYMIQLSFPPTWWRSIPNRFDACCREESICIELSSAILSILPKQVGLGYIFPHCPCSFSLSVLWMWRRRCSSFSFQSNQWLVTSWLPR